MPNVYLNYGQPDQIKLRVVTAQEMSRLKRFGFFKAGSMLPKVEAAIAFSKYKKGNIGIITDIDNLYEALRGRAGTIVH